MWIHLPHVEDGFGVTFNYVTKDTVFYTTTSRFVAYLGVFPQERQKLWCPKDDLRDSSSWASPPLVLLPHLNHLVEVSFVWDESSTSNTDVTDMSSQFKVTKQILLHWQPFRTLDLV
jgi:hypothetical protein